MAVATQPTQDQETDQMNALRETTEEEVPGTDKFMKKYPVVIPYVKGMSD